MSLKTYLSPRMGDKVRHLWHNNAIVDYVTSGFRDTTIIPDKYNTGADLTAITHTIPAGGTAIPCTANGVPATMNVTEASSGKYFNIDFRYNGTNRDLTPPIVVENVDFSLKSLVFNNAHIMLSYKDVEFRNCVFSFVYSPHDAPDLLTKYRNCTAGGIFRSNVDILNSHLGGTNGDAMQPGYNFKIKDSFISNLAHDVGPDETNSVLHTDGMQVIGDDEYLEVTDLIVDNVRCEAPRIDYTNNSARGNSVYVNTCFGIVPEKAPVRGPRMNNVIANGGGHSFYFTKDDPVYDCVVDGMEVGYAREFSAIYEEESVIADPEITILNKKDINNLYVSSVWRDGNGLNVVVSNDTYGAIDLTVVTENGTTTHNIPAMPNYHQNNGDGHTYAEYPFDVLITLADSEWVICYSGTPSDESQIRFVNWGVQDIPKPY